MGLKGYRSWVMGQLDSNVQEPRLEREARDGDAAVVAACHHPPQPRVQRVGLHPKP
jgi:hypothetical protein